MYDSLIYPNLTESKSTKSLRFQRYTVYTSLRVSSVSKRRLAPRRLGGCHTLLPLAFDLRVCASRDEFTNLA